MLDNTRRGFTEELVIGLTLTAVLSFALSYFPAPFRMSAVEFFVIIFIAGYVLFGGTLRIIRWAIVFRSPAYLLLLNLTAFALIVISYSALSQGLTITNILTAGFFLSIVVFYYLYLLHLKRNGKLLSGTPPIRVKILVKAKLTRLQRLTLIFPDNYIKYLETGDEKYLKEGEKS